MTESSQLKLRVLISFQMSLIPICSRIMIYFVMLNLIQNFQKEIYLNTAFIVSECWVLECSFIHYSSPVSSWKMRPCFLGVDKSDKLHQKIQTNSQCLEVWADAATQMVWPNLFCFCFLYLVVHVHGRVDLFSSAFIYFLVKSEVLFFISLFSCRILYT